jgi:hypothetical protein
MTAGPDVARRLDPDWLRRSATANSPPARRLSFPDFLPVASRSGSVQGSDVDRIVRARWSRCVGAVDFFYTARDRVPDFQTVLLLSQLLNESGTQSAYSRLRTIEEFVEVNRPQTKNTVSLFS